MYFIFLFFFLAIQIHIFILSMQTVKQEDRCAEIGCENAAKSVFPFTFTETNTTFRSCNAHAMAVLVDVYYQQYVDAGLLRSGIKF